MLFCRPSSASNPQYNRETLNLLWAEVFPSIFTSDVPFPVSVKTISLFRIQPFAMDPHENPAIKPWVALFITSPRAPLQPMAGELAIRRTRSISRRVEFRLSRSWKLHLHLNVLEEAKCFPIKRNGEGKEELTSIVRPQPEKSKRMGWNFPVNAVSIKEVDTIDAV